jgi:hypothetical protein
MADPAAKEEEREQAFPPVPAPSPSSSPPPPPPPPPQEQQEPQCQEQPLLDTFWRWPLLVLLVSYVILLYVRDATTDTTKKEAAGVIPSHQQPHHTNGQRAPVVIHPERTATASQDGKPLSASSSLSFPIAGGGGGGGGGFHQHPHILVQYCTS